MTLGVVVLMLHLPWDVPLASSNLWAVFRLVQYPSHLIGRQSVLTAAVVLLKQTTVLAEQRKLLGSRRMIPGHDRSDYLKIKVDTHKEEGEGSEEEEEEEGEDVEPLSLPLSQVSSSQGSCRKL